MPDIIDEGAKEILQSMINEINWINESDIEIEDLLND
jgi:hypothetical protein